VLQPVANLCLFLIIILRLGVITSVWPTQAPISGGYYVTIIGTDLGEHDITNVQLGVGPFDCNIVSQNRTVVVVTTTFAVTTGLGMARVISPSHGTSTLNNAFQFNPGTLPAVLELIGLVTSIIGCCNV